MEEKKPRGFAAMNPDRIRELGRIGGRTAHQMGKAHRFTSEEAMLAGKRSHEDGGAHEWTIEEAKEAGKRGGEASRGRPRKRRVDTSKDVQ